MARPYSTDLRERVVARVVAGDPVRRWRRPVRAHRHRLDTKRLVFIDETWAKTNMAPLRGWAPRGRRLAARTPQAHWKNMSR